MKRPTFFISSTIYDFRDLRSAIKYFLEEQGCKVLASEFNDFTKPLDLHSYEACLRSIHSADYFILLIGSRIGGWYDETAKVSITQREYREAYQLQGMGKLKLLNFVRSEVWHVREDRRELAKFLESASIAEGMRKVIANYPSKFAADAEALSQFIEEVARNRETKLAVQGKGPAPSGNWIHVVSGFRDIIDVLHGQIFSSTPVEDMTVKRLLRRELRGLAAQCLMKLKDGSVVSPRFAIDRFHAEHPVSLDAREEKFITVSEKRWNLISSMSIHLLALQLHPVVLPEVISRPTFLEFDLSSDSYKETVVYEALLLLQDEIRRFNSGNTSEVLSVVFEYSRPKHPRTGEWIEIETLKLARLLHLLDRWSNVLDLSASLIRHLEGQPFTIPSLRPESPIEGMQQLLDEERRTDTDVDDFLKRSRG